LQTNKTNQKWLAEELKNNYYYLIENACKISIEGVCGIISQSKYLCYAFKLQENELPFGKGKIMNSQLRAWQGNRKILI